MSLINGQKVNAETLSTLTVKKKLGEGGQGAVFLVESKNGQYALKWYNIEQSTPDQETAIRKLASAGPPKGIAGQRFVWPLDLVKAPGNRQFGYLMPLIDISRYAELGEIQARLKPRPSFTALCEISYQAANSYRALHLEGYCYRDISAGNLMFDPVSGDVLICDNDNVGINRQSDCQVLGTAAYMAPELVRRESSPSTETDLHSLAVLLFHLWVWHHPLHGDLEYQVRSWDEPAKRRVYGDMAIFIYDPQDKRNQLPKDPDYAGADKMWNLCPSSLREHFTRAFTLGLKDPRTRVTEGEWQKLFLQLGDGIRKCGCKAENFWEPGQGELSCWNCRRVIPVSPALRFAHPAGPHFLLLDPEARVLNRHINAAQDAGSNDVIGRVVQNPANPQILGIRNLTQQIWSATFPDGTMKEITPQRAVPIGVGIKLNIGGTVAEIVQS